MSQCDSEQINNDEFIWVPIDGCGVFIYVEEERLWYPAVTISCTETSGSFLLYSRSEPMELHNLKLMVTPI